jgi:nitrogenase-stabilizing/protective protein
MMSGAAAGVLERLSKASSAEDFFEMLGVDYDPKHVNVVRLHILRRMGQYLVSEDFTGLPDEVVAERCKTRPTLISSRHRRSTSAFSRS